MQRLRFIRRAQKLGFSLAEIGELLSLRSAPGARAIDVRRKVEEKLLEVQQKIEHLREIAEALEQLSNSCDGKGAVDDCAILGALCGE